MSWQKCPVCDGTGIDLSKGTFNTAMPICPTCQGKRIISILSGLPPIYSTDIKTNIDLPPMWIDSPSLSKTDITTPHNERSSSNIH